MLHFTIRVENPDAFEHGLKGEKRGRARFREVTSAEHKTEGIDTVCFFLLAEALKINARAEDEKQRN